MFFTVGSFQNAIMQSGCAFNPWAFNKKHKEAAFHLAKQLGCQKDDPKEIVKYLLNVPANELVKCSATKVRFEVCIIHFLLLNIYIYT